MNEEGQVFGKKKTIAAHSCEHHCFSKIANEHFNGFFHWILLCTL
jgi:hypothetical protein